jgi:hypothetical protein
MGALDLFPSAVLALFGILAIVVPLATKEYEKCPQVAIFVVVLGVVNMIGALLTIWVMHVEDKSSHSSPVGGGIVLIGGGILIAGLHGLAILVGTIICAISPCASETIGSVAVFGIEAGLMLLFVVFCAGAYVCA